MTLVANQTVTMDVDPSILEARKKLFGKAVDCRTGGKGTARRKKRVVHKVQGTDDKKLQGTLKRLGLNTIPGCEEVNMFRDNQTVLQFSNPKVQACINANTYVITGPADEKKLSDMTFGGSDLLSQLGPENIPLLKKIKEGAANAARNGADADDDDDEVPNLVDTNFEEVSKN